MSALINKQSYLCVCVILQTYKYSLAYFLVFKKMLNVNENSHEMSHMA